MLILIVITLLVDLSVFAVVRCLVVAGNAMNPTVAVLVPKLRRVMLIVLLLLIPNFLRTAIARVTVATLKSVRLMVLHV